MQQQIKRQIDRLKGKGATYVDARWFPVEESNTLVMLSGNLKAANATRESGVGIRVLYKGAWGFSASSDLGNLPGLFEKAFDNAKVGAEAGGKGCHHRQLQQSKSY
jgi:TldD protein